MSSMLGRAGAVATVAVLFTIGCSDAGTRVAYDIESGATQLGAREGDRIIVTHVPRSRPEGCAGAYRLTIERGSAIADGHGNFRLAAGAGGLSVLCLGASGGGSTTYHLRFVDVPATLTVTKAAGEATVIEIRRVDRRAAIVGMR